MLKSFYSLFFKIEKSSPQLEKEIDELSHQQEIYALQLGANKKATEELNVDREKLMFEKNLHLRELKRIHDEEQSRFNDCPILGPSPSQKRYILLQLLGKGGFSEVYKVNRIKIQKIFFSFLFD